MSNQSEMSKRQIRRDQIRRKEQRGRWIGIGLITIGALLVAFLIIWPNVKPITGITIIDPAPRPQANANSMGNPEAPVKIVEYSDFQCPFCENFFNETEPKLVENYISTGKVYFTYRSTGNWVSANIGGGLTESEDAAKAAYCAGDQNMYWEMHDMIFANVLGEDVGSFTDRRLAAIAEKTGLDMNQYNDCYSSDKFADQAFQDGKDALLAGVQGTPSFVLTYTDANGNEVTELIEGAQPFSVFQEKIDAALAIVSQ
ncbi:MAG: thioredoxin domain-containing protein [Chloroflexi bacterium]|nr:thioredoxin domain-containing protein [Chloroflexota bacterium]